MNNSTKKKLATVAFYISNILIAIIFVSPLIWMIVSSLKPESKIFSELNSIKTFFPTDISIINYTQVFERIPMLKYIFNSLFYSAIIIVFDLIVNSMCGYALAKLEFKGKNILMTLVISLMVLPLEAIMLPLYVEISSLGWVNTWAALIVPFIAKCFSIYMFRQFFIDIPDELIEAAEIDGCSVFKIFYSIVVPISGSAYATIFILDFTAHWNDFMWPMLVITSEKLRTIQLAIQTFFGQPPIYYGPIMAALTISAIPMIVLFIFFQKYYVQGIATTGIKG